MSFIIIIIIIIIINTEYKKHSVDCRKKKHKKLKQTTVYVKSNNRYMTASTDFQVTLV